MNSFCNSKSYSHFFQQNISVYAISNDQSFNDMLTTISLVLNNWALVSENIDGMAKSVKALRNGSSSATLDSKSDRKEKSKYNT